MGSKALLTLSFAARTSWFLASADLTIGTGSSFVAGPNVTIVGTVNCTLTDGTVTQCLSLKTTDLPDHPAGPWCNGGNWLGAVYNISLSYNSIGYDCNNENTYTVCPSNIPQCTRCLECAAKQTNNAYLIPLTPKRAPTPGSAAAEFGYGAGIGLNGIPMAGADPVEKLVSQNNPAPIDWCGGHATLQYSYHYHVIPTCITNAVLGPQQGWFLSNYSWSTSAPDKRHSPHIGWSLDGYPVFGPFTEGGVVPVVKGSAATDTDTCYGHTESGNSYGYHYHARIIHDGKTDVFHGCMAGLLESGTAAKMSNRGGVGPGGGAGGGGPGGGAMACSAGQTAQCCGDKTCDGPETSSNCPADCSANSVTATSNMTNAKARGANGHFWPVLPTVLLALSRLLLSQFTQLD